MGRSGRGLAVTAPGTDRELIGRFIDDRPDAAVVVRHGSRGENGGYPDHSGDGRYSNSGRLHQSPAVLRRDHGHEPDRPGDPPRPAGFRGRTAPFRSRCPPPAMDLPVALLDQPLAVMQWHDGVDPRRGVRPLGTGRCSRRSLGSWSSAGARAASVRRGARVPNAQAPHEGVRTGGCEARRVASAACSSSIDARAPVVKRDACTTS